MSTDLDFESLVNLYYQALYRFALSLTHSEADACDLTQQTFYLWATKGHQLRDATRVKAWLFTTLHRQFLERGRRQGRFPHFDLDQVAEELPVLSPEVIQRLDGSIILQALSRMDAAFHAPLALFYLEDHSYKEIADILEIPMGTVKSRIFRGLALLQRTLSEKSTVQPQNIAPHG